MGVGVVYMGKKACLCRSGISWQLWAKISERGLFGRRVQYIAVDVGFDLGVSEAHRAQQFAQLQIFRVQLVVRLALKIGFPASLVTFEHSLFEILEIFLLSGP